MRIIVYKVTYSNTVRTFQLLDILYTNVFRCNWYNSLLTEGRNSSCLGLTTRDAIDTLEAVTLGRNWYNLTAGRNSYFPHWAAESNRRRKEYFTFYKNYFLLSSNFKSICQIKGNSINDCDCLKFTISVRRWPMWLHAPGANKPSYATESMICVSLTLILLTWRIWWASNNANRWQMGLNSAFKGLNYMTSSCVVDARISISIPCRCYFLLVLL